MPRFDLMADGDLLAASSRRDRAAFAELVNRHYRSVYRLAWRMTAGHADSEDIAQDAFIKLWGNPAQIREAGALKGWLMRVAANAVIDRTRKPTHADMEVAANVADPTIAADGHLSRTQASRLVDESIAALPDRQRLALSLVYFEGMSNIETALAMDLSVEAVESLLSRARRGLKRSLASEWRNLLDGLTTSNS
ncbi:MAG: sigma-70 family RNA polymerase sigma factor [Alphaproteobacteria bacterium]|nr:sigma-70 family RNA polymerase sigma factor [Alphaproteobacteria bacterium]